MHNVNKVLDHIGISARFVGEDKANLAKEVITKYAKEVAQEALKDAAERYKGATMKDEYGCVCDVPGAILSTTIVTP